MGYICNTHNKSCDKATSTGECSGFIENEDTSIELTQREKDIISLALSWLAQFSYSYKMFDSECNLSITHQEICNLTTKICKTSKG